MNKTLLTVKDLTAFLGVSRSTIYRWMSHNNFPKQRNIGPNTVRWSTEEVEGWKKHFFQ